MSSALAHEPRARRAATRVIAAVVSVVLAACAVAAGSTSSGVGAFVLFFLGMPWILAIYVITMVFDVTSPVAIAITFVLVTLLVWRFVSRALVRTLS